MLATLSWKSAWSASLLVSLLLVVGCSGEGTVTGKVTCQGKLVSSGTVIFHAANHATISAPIDENGKYRAPRVPVGEAKVSVLNPLPPSDPDHPGPPKPLPNPPPVPLKYKDPDNGLKLTVHFGSQRFDIDLIR